MYQECSYLKIITKIKNSIPTTTVGVTKRFKCHGRSKFSSKIHNVRLICMYHFFNKLIVIITTKYINIEYLYFMHIHC